MNVKYAGPKVFITHHGVTFEDGKEDKYVYLMIGIQILKAIDKDFGEQKSYSYDINTKRLNNEEIKQTMLKYEPQIEQKTYQEIETYKKRLETEIEDVKNKNLTELEKEVLTNNLQIMKDYRLQRASNKIYYMYNIKKIAAIIKREKITEIDTPFYEKYWHVLMTIQGELAKERVPIGSELKIEKNNKGDMVSKLIVLNI
ncbi:MAG: hypothetical protein JJV88_03090 [Sulfurovum sp.]|nr:hypothetical protein [Sulfurovaceae bacterium]